MKQEYEIIKHPYIKYVNLFMAGIGYRTPHLHSDFEIMFFTKGVSTYTTPNKTESFNSGEIVLLNSGEVHEIERKSESSLMICLQVSPKYFKHIFPEMENIKFDDLNVNRYLDSSEMKKLKMDIIFLTRLYIKRNPLYELEVAQKIISIFKLFLQRIPYRVISEEEKINSRVKAERLNRIISYIEEHFTEKIGLKEIAQIEGVSVSFLSHFITENLNQTFQEFVKNLRLNKAVELISNTNMKLIEICVASGFSDYRYINEAFIDKYGFSPKEFRSKNKSVPNEKNVGYETNERIFSEEDILKYLKSNFKGDNIYD